MYVFFVLGASKRESEPVQKKEPPDSQSRVAGTLHEVSNALTVVLGWLERAVDGTSLEEVKRAARVAQEHARRGRALARRSIGAEANPEVDRRSAPELAEFAAVSVEPQAEAQSVRVLVEVEPDSEVCIDGDQEAVQVLTNLLLNAIDFSPFGQPVHLRVESVESVESGESGESGEPMVRFIVEDSGPGVPEELLGRLFDQGVTTRPEGAGIGLPLSRRLARRHGGELRLDNPGQPGARFVMEWPVAPPAQVVPLSGATPSGERASSEVRPTLDGLRILVIEDDQAIISLVQLTLEARGADLLVVDSSERLNELLSEHPEFDLVLLDLSPVISRLSEVLQHLRDLSPRAPILLMSGEPSGIPLEARGQIHSWVRKPFDMAQLIDSARQALAERN